MNNKAIPVELPVILRGAFMNYRDLYGKKTKQPVVIEIRESNTKAFVLKFDDRYVYWLEEQLKKRSAELTKLKKRYKKLASYD